MTVADHQPLAWMDCTAAPLKAVSAAWIAHGSDVYLVLNQCVPTCAHHVQLNPNRTADAQAHVLKTKVILLARNHCKTFCVQQYNMDHKDVGDHIQVHRVERELNSFRWQLFRACNDALPKCFQSDDHL